MRFNVYAGLAAKNGPDDGKQTYGVGVVITDTAGKVLTKDDVVLRGRTRRQAHLEAVDLATGTLAGELMRLGWPETPKGSKRKPSIRRVIREAVGLNRPRIEQVTLLVSDAGDHLDFISFTKGILPSCAVEVVNVDASENLGCREAQECLNDPLVEYVDTH